MCHYSYRGSSSTLASTANGYVALHSETMKKPLILQTNSRTEHLNPHSPEVFI